MPNLFPRLPADLAELVVAHWAAGVLQAHLMRWHRYRHVRRRAWGRLRAQLPRPVHATLVRYARVRHEWHREPESWLDQPEEVLRTILDEAADGLWGCPLA